MSIRREVLKVFKQLHKTRKYVFEGDDRALKLAREKINEEFKNNKTLRDESKIQHLVKYTEEVDKELRTTVIQAKEVKPNYYVARIKPETVKLDNVPFKACCQEESVKK